MLRDLLQKRKSKVYYETISMKVSLHMFINKQRLSTTYIYIYVNKNTTIYIHIKELRNHMKNEIMKKTQKK